MENVRIAILDKSDTTVAFMDNMNEDSFHYFDDSLEIDLSGGSSFFDFKVYNSHPDSVYLQVGNKIAFRWNNKDFYFNIMKTTTDKRYISVACSGLSLELINEETDELLLEEDETGKKIPNERTFVQYMDQMYAELANVEIGINEISGKRLSLEFHSAETILKRLLRLAENFDAEIEFVPQFNSDYSFKKCILNIYSKSKHGIGQDKTNRILRYGQDHKGVKREIDISNMYTAFRPKIEVSVYEARTDDQGNISKDSQTGVVNLTSKKQCVTLNGFVGTESRFPIVGYDVRFPEARDRFPSTLLSSPLERYILHIEDVETELEMEEIDYQESQISQLTAQRNAFIDSVKADIYRQACEALEKYSVPQLKYTFDGYIEADIGDTFTIEDSTFNPPLYAEARIVKQNICFTDPSKSKTTFDNFTELNSEILDNVTKYVIKLVEDSKTYDVSISATNGTIFKADSEETTLCASVRDGGRSVTDQFHFKWLKNEVLLSTADEITLTAQSVIEAGGKISIVLEAYDTSELLKGKSFVDVIAVRDGSAPTLVSTTYHYYISDDGLNHPDADSSLWVASIPEDSDLRGKWIWVKTTYVMSKGDSLVTYAQSYVGTDADITEFKTEYYLKQDEQDAKFSRILGADIVNGEGQTIATLNTSIFHDANGLEIDVSQLYSLVSQHELTLNRYFKFAADGLTIGKQDDSGESAGQFIQICENDIHFGDGSMNVFNTMSRKELSIIKSLKLGDWIFQVRDDGSLDVTKA